MKQAQSSLIHDVAAFKKHAYLCCHSQVLPPDMTELSDPSAEGLCASLCKALERVGDVQPMEQHRRVSAEM